MYMDVASNSLFYFDVRLLVLHTANRQDDKRDNETLVRLTFMYIMDFVLLFDIIVRLRMAVVTPNGRCIVVFLKIVRWVIYLRQEKQSGGGTNKML